MNPEVEKIPIPKDAALDGKVLLRLWKEKYDLPLYLFDDKDYEILTLKITAALVSAYQRGLSLVLDAISEHVEATLMTKHLEQKQTKKKVAKKKAKKKTKKKAAKKKKLALTPKLPSTDDL